MKALQVATFPSSFSAACECRLSDGAIAEQDCSTVTVFDETGQSVAHWKSDRYRLALGEDGSIVVFAMPAAQSKGTQDSLPVQTREHFSQLAELNRLNESFWRKRNGEN